MNIKTDQNICNTLHAFMFSVDFADRNRWNSYNQLYFPNQWLLHACISSAWEGDAGVTDIRTFGSSLSFLNSRCPAVVKRTLCSMFHLKLNAFKVHRKSDSKRNYFLSGHSHEPMKTDQRTAQS